ncbi:hypothetical protein TSUD_219190 [Trifolium subterraneum]|uniref:RNase H type-1 domain-containing protein n=1 Tax=Trifolium subterraneum TaxID=3900 RepID=A0A2Z6MY97_TRISU|nr:hypothetical protein TSUD_219190 [Trifolium subterraneum]
MDTLVHLGIPQELQNIIFHCISSASMNINWNGNMTESFNPGEWARYSFGRGDCPKLSHICFADDLILVAEATETQVDCVNKVLHEFCQKSGAPMIHQRISKQSFAYLLDKMRKTLSGWKAKTLSFASRVTLAQTSLVHNPGYVLQSIPISVSVCQEVEQICRNFIWETTAEARKVHLIAWDKLCHPKSEGGLGFRNLKMLNKAHMMKLSWQILTQPSKLWVKILKAKYNCGNITWVIRDGVDSQFWRHPWIPNVGALEDHIAASIPREELNFPVNHYASDGLWKWDKIRSIVPNDICDKIAVIKPPSQGAPDFPCWKLSVDGYFSLKTAYEFMENQHQEDLYINPIFEKVWHWKGPNRIKAFLWKLSQGRLLTNEERRHRNMTNSDLCPRCQDYPEQPGEVVAVSWKPLLDGWHKVNVDGSFNTISGSTACGGLIRNQHGIFVKGFYSKIGSSNAIWAEMWALRIGIRIAQNSLLPKVVFEMDSKQDVGLDVVTLCTTAQCTPFSRFLEDLFSCEIPERFG